MSESRDLTLSYANQKLVIVEQAGEGAVGLAIVGAKGFVRWDEPGSAIRDLRIIVVDDPLQRIQDRLQEVAFLSDFAAQLDNQLRVVAEDPRLRMNGHDFTALLAWYLDKSGLRSRSGADEIGGMLAVATENDWLAETALFRRVLGFGRN